MRRRTIAVYAVLGIATALAALFFMLNMTNPVDSGPAGILVVLTLIYGLSYSAIVLLSMVFGYIYRLIAPRHDETTLAEAKKQRSLRKNLAVCAVLAATPFFAISLNSIGRMGFVDMLLIAAIESVAIFYISKKL